MRRSSRWPARSAVQRRGLDFSALDHQPVYSIVLLLSPENQPQQHLQAMNIVFSNLQKDMFRRFLKLSDTREKIVELLDEADQGKKCQGNAERGIKAHCRMKNNSSTFLILQF